MNKIGLACEIKGGRPYWPLFILGLLGASLLTSCASIGRNFQINALDQITIGKTTMAETREALGDPLKDIDVATWGYKRMHFGDEKDATIWIYLYASGSALDAHGKSMQVDFDIDGKVTNYTFNSNFNEDKIKQAKDDELKDFDLFTAKDKIMLGKTTKDKVLALLGKPFRELVINKPGAGDRWMYFYKKKSKDEKIVIGHTWLGDEDINKVYGKTLYVDFKPKGLVADLRGESDFPEDKDRFFTK